MGSKNEPGAFDCYHNALPDESMFILLARDPSAPKLVEDWAAERQHQIDRGFRPKSDQAMVDEAVRCAAHMQHWRIINNGSWCNPATQSAPVTPHALWTDEDYEMAKVCMMTHLAQSYDWPIGEKDFPAFDDAFQHAIGILSITALAITQSAPVLTASHSGERDPSVMPDCAGADTEAGEACDGCGKLLVCRHCGKFRSA